jgi:predicted tellurium resistance membrane protein TerC
LIVFGSSLVLAVLNKFPILVWAGAALLGWIAGELIGTDPTIAAWMHKNHFVHWWGPAGLVLVMLAGSLARLFRKPAQIED